MSRLVLAAPVARPRALDRLAQRTATRLRRLWGALLARARQGIDEDALAAALQVPHLLDAEQVVMQQWQQQVEDPARDWLPVRFGEVYTQAAALVQRERAQLAGRPVGLPTTPAMAQALAAEAQQQVTALTRTTLLGLRHLLRGGQGRTVLTRSARIQTGFGLTPLQLQALAAAQARWQAAGHSTAQIQDATAQAAGRALRARGQSLAQTQAYRAVNMSLRLALAQAAQSSPAGGSLVRRHWTLGEDPCATCAQMPGLNAGGVGLEEAFVTPAGLLLDPPLHPHCACLALVH